MHLKIVSWNIWCGKYLEEVESFLQQSTFDVLCLQEVLEDDAKLLSEKLQCQYSWAPNFKLEIGEKVSSIGNAIFTKNKIIRKRARILSGDENPRSALEADVQIGGAVLHVFSTHLTHSCQKPSELQEQQSTKLIRALTKENTMVMGDFNAVGDSKTIKKISRVLKNADGRNLPTWSVYPEGCEDCNPQGIEYKLDYIFISKDIKVVSYKVESSKASDHLPISAIVEM